MKRTLKHSQASNNSMSEVNVNGGTSIIDKTRRVTIGPVAQQLSGRRARPASYYWPSRVAGLLAVMGCAVMVFFAIQNVTSNLTTASLDLPARNKTAVEDTDHRVKTDSQVRTVIELVGAFEDVASENSPLDIPRRSDRSTAMIGVYAPTKKQTEDFLAKINSPKVTAAFELDKAAPGGIADLIQSDQKVDDTDDISKAPIAGDSEPTEPVTAMDASEFAEKTEPVGGLAIADAQGARNDPADLSGSLSAYLDKNDSRNNASRNTEPIGEPLPAEPALLERTAEETIGSPQKTATAEDSVDELVRENETVELDEQPIGTSGTPSTEIENTEIQDVALAEAIASHEQAFSKWLKTADRTTARNYYAALAQLAENVHNTEGSVLAQQARRAISALHGNPKLQQLVSAATPSWIRWSKRHTNGVVVVGMLESVTQHPNGVQLAIRTADRQASLVLAIVSDDDMADLTSSPSVVVAGVIGKPDAMIDRPTENTIGPVVVGQLIHL